MRQEIATLLLLGYHLVYGTSRKTSDNSMSPAVKAPGRYTACNEPYHSKSQTLAGSRNTCQYAPVLDHVVAQYNVEGHFCSRSLLYEVSLRCRQRSVETQT